MYGVIKLFIHFSLCYCSRFFTCCRGNYSRRLSDSNICASFYY